MKKTLLTMLLSLTLLLTSCINYSDYKEVKIPDDNLGTVKIPKNWEFKVIDDWIHIIDIEKDETIGIQIFYGVDHYIGGIRNDERIFNPYFDNHEYILGGITSGNSNGGNWGKITYIKNELSHEHRLVEFMGSTDSYYDIRIIIIDNSIEDSVLSNIAKSYKR